MTFQESLSLDRQNHGLLLFRCSISSFSKQSSNLLPRIQASADSDALLSAWLTNLSQSVRMHGNGYQEAITAKQILFLVLFRRIKVKQ